MRLSAAAAIAVARPGLIAGTATGIFLRPEPAPPPRPRPIVRPASEPPTTTTPAAPAAPKPEKSHADLQKAMRDDPNAFAATLRGDEKLETLLSALCVAPGMMFFPADQIPPPVLEAVRDLLKSGTTAQKLAIVHLLENMVWMGPDPPIKKEEIVDRASGFLTEKDPQLRALAVALLERYAPTQTDSRFDVLQELMRTSSDSAVRSICIGSLAHLHTPEARELLLKAAAQVASDPAALKDLRLWGATLGSLQSQALALPPEEVASICGSALRNTPDPSTFQQWADLAFRLPLPRATTLLEQVRDSAPTPELQAGAKRALEQIRAGETRADRLQGAFRQAMK